MLGDEPLPTLKIFYMKKFVGSVEEKFFKPTKNRHQVRHHRSGGWECKMFSHLARWYCSTANHERVVWIQAAHAVVAHRDPVEWKPHRNPPKSMTEIYHSIVNAQKIPQPFQGAVRDSMNQIWGFCAIESDNKYNAISFFKCLPYYFRLSWQRFACYETSSSFYYEKARMFVH